MQALIHQNKMDLISVYNKTQNFYFKASVMNAQLIEKIQISSGMKQIKISGGLIINGLSNIKIGDILLIMNKEIKVKQISTNLDKNQFKFRIDYENFTGTTEVMY